MSRVTNSKKESILWEIMDPTDISGKGVLWTSKDSLFTQTFPNPEANQPVTYRVRLTVFAENGCRDTTSQYITIYPSPKIRIEGENQLCYGDSNWLKIEAIYSAFISHQCNYAL